MFPSTSPNHFPSFIINHDPFILTATPTFSSFEMVHMSNNDSNIKNRHDKKPSLVKKKSHSKIRTAQGLRDRRVRLSIGIARKFFDLQDTLGFDKASKTLEWLLTKSKSSILELTQTDTTTRNNHGDHETTAEESNNGSTLCPKTKNKLNNLSKVVSREKARERARLRTRAKMYVQSSIAQMQEIIANVPVSNNTLHNRPSTTTRVPPSSEIVTEESIVVKLRMKPIFGNYYHHQNIITTTATKDVTNSISTSSNNNIPNLPQNWDGGGALMRSSFYAKINRDLSTEFQIDGKQIGVSPQYLAGS